MLKLFRWLFGRPLTPEQNLAMQARSNSPKARHSAAALLGDANQPWAGPHLVTLLGDGITEVRNQARASLTRMGNTAVPALIDGLTSASEPAALTSAELLGEMRAVESARALLTAMKYSSTRKVQMAAKRSLVALGTAAVPVLEEAQDEEQPWMRRQVEEALTLARASSQGVGISANVPGGEVVAEQGG